MVQIVSSQGTAFVIDVSTLKEHSRGNYLSTHVVSQTDSNSQGIFWKDLSHSSIACYQVLCFSQSDYCVNLQLFSPDLLSVEDSSPKSDYRLPQLPTSLQIIVTHRNLLTTTEHFSNCLFSTDYQSSDKYGR